MVFRVIGKVTYLHTHNDTDTHEQTNKRTHTQNNTHNIIQKINAYAEIYTK